LLATNAIGFGSAPMARFYATAVAPAYPSTISTFAAAA
jgi:hypothetical protein